MTKKKNMTAGQRQASLEKRIEQLEQATRISQMLLQQTGNSTNNMRRDFDELANRQRDIQYRLLALQEMTDVDKDVLLKRSEELQIKDFTETSQKEDEEKGYTESEVVDENSVVVLTSSTDDPTNSILRSKLEMSEIAFPQLRDDLIGSKKGDVVNAEINGVNHEITLLQVLQKPPQEEGADTAEENNDGSAAGETQDEQAVAES